MLSTASSSGFQPMPSCRIAVTLPTYVHNAGIGLIYAGDDLKQGAFSAAIASHDAERFTLANVEGDAIEHVVFLPVPGAE